MRARRRSLPWLLRGGSGQASAPVAQRAVALDGAASQVEMAQAIWSESPGEAGCAGVSKSNRSPARRGFDGDLFGELEVDWKFLQLLSQLFVFD